MSSGEPEEWLLSPFEELERPEFPVAVLPTELRAWVEGLATELEVPLALPGCLALGALAATVSNRLHVEPRPGYLEPLNLYLAIALPPGERKSAAFRAAVAPLHEWQARAREREGPRIRALQEARRAEEERLKHMHARLAKIEEPLERAQALADIEELALKLECWALPVLPRLVVDDVTPEELAVLMAEQGERLAVLSAEGGLFGMLEGRYTDGMASLDVYLKGHSEDYLDVERVGRAPVRLEHPALTVAVTLQPQVLSGLAKAPTLRGCGVLARFFNAVPASQLTKRTWGTPPMRSDTRDAYGQLLAKLLDADIDGQALRLTPEAGERWLGFALELEPHLGEDGMADWQGKLPGAVARIAGLLHCARYPVAPHAHQVSLGDVGAAVALGWFFHSHARLAFALLSASPEVERAKKVASWLKRERLSSFTRRDCHQAHRSLFSTVDELGLTLGLLGRHGYIRARTQKERGKVPGRPPSTTYDVHPSLRGEP